MKCCHPLVKREIYKPYLVPLEWNMKTQAHRHVATGYVSDYTWQEGYILTGPICTDRDMKGQRLLRVIMKNDLAINRTIVLYARD